MKRILVSSYTSGYTHNIIEVECKIIKLGICQVIRDLVKIGIFIDGSKYKTDD